MAGANEGVVLLCVGSIDRAEFREVLPTLEPQGTVLTAPTIRTAVRRLAQASLTPDVVVVVQSYPGEFADAQVDQLRRVAPLARFVTLLGTWCEGEMRSGAPLSGTIRVYWHQWVPQAYRELNRLIAGGESPWSLPPTACEEERCLAIAARPGHRGGGLVEIVTEQYDVFDWLATACLKREYTPRWRRAQDDSRSDSPVAVLFDAAGEIEKEASKLRRLSVDRRVPVIVLADFPRIADCDRLMSAGANAVLSRPFFWDDLFWYFPASACRLAPKESAL
ncbi:MAG: hypothetical protein GXX96_38875 [Planctomycetaceae bacterium]|nr:hypothetical protein [Planctomycetaceae bacterium]